MLQNKLLAQSNTLFTLRKGNLTIVTILNGIILGVLDIKSYGCADSLL